MNLKELNFWEILNNGCFLITQAIKKIETMKVLSYYALAKIHLRKQKPYFRFILLLSSDVNITPRPDTNYDQHDVNTLPFMNSSFSDNETGISNVEK